MTGKYFKSVAILLAFLLTAGMLVSCKKDENKNNETKSTSSASAIKSSTPVKSTASPSKSAATKSTSTGTVTRQETTGASAGEAAASVNAPGNSESSGELGNESSDAVNDTSIPKELNIDLKGRTITIATWYIKTYFNFDDLDSIRTKVFKKGQEKYNFKVEYIEMPMGTLFPEFINKTLAGIKFADAITAETKTAFPNFVANNLIIPTDDYIDYTSPAWNMPVTNITKWYGKHYGINIIAEPASWGIYYNREIMAREGITDIYDMQKAGNWSWDTFLDVALRTTKDFNGDGVVDQWGIAADPSTLGMELIYSNDGTYIEEDGGKLKFALDSHSSLSAIQFLSDLFNTYKVAAKSNLWGKLQHFDNGAAAMITHAGWNGGHFKSAGLTDVGFVSAPKGPNCQGNTYFLPGAAFLTFTSLMEEPEKAIPALADSFSFWDSQKIEHQSMEDALQKSAESNMYSQKDVDMYIDMATNVKELKYVHSSFPEFEKQVNSQVLNKVIGQVTTPAAAVQSIQQQCQSIIDDMMASSYNQQ